MPYSNYGYNYQPSGGNDGCGCLILILTYLALWALFIGLPTPWGTLNIDIIPPAIRLIK